MGNSKKTMKLIAIVLALAIIANASAYTCRALKCECRGAAGCAFRMHTMKTLKKAGTKSTNSWGAYTCLGAALPCKSGDKPSRDACKLLKDRWIETGGQSYKHWYYNDTCIASGAEIGTGMQFKEKNGQTTYWRFATTSHGHKTKTRRNLAFKGLD